MDASQRPSDVTRDVALSGSVADESGERAGGIAAAFASRERVRLLWAVLAGPQPLATLAEAAGVEVARARRHLDALCARGIFSRESGTPGDCYTFAATPLAATVRAMVAASAPSPQIAPADAQLDGILGHLSAGVALYDRGGELVRLNEAGKRITRRGVVPGETAPLRQQRYQMRHGDGRPLAEEDSPSGRARRGQTFSGLEFLIDGQHGENTLLVCSGSPLYTRDGQPGGAVVIFEDVTKQRLLADEEHRQRTLADAIIEHAPVGVALYDVSDEFRCIRHNSTFLALVGPEFRAQGGIVGVPLDVLFDADTRARVRAIYESVRATRRPFTIDEFPAVLLPDPEPRWYRWSLTPLRDERGELYALLNSAIEITELVRGRERLRETAAQLEGVIAAMPEAVAVADGTGAFILANETAEALWGRETPEGAETDEYADIFRCFEPDGRALESHELPLPRALAGEVVRGQEVVYQRPDGSRVDLLCSAAPLRFGRGDEIAGGVVVFQDITRLKELERQRDEFLSVAAHELRTPLATILATLQMFERQLDGRSARPATSASLLRGASRMYRQAQRLDALVGDLLDTSRIQAGRIDFTMDTCDLAALIREVAEQQHTAHPHRAIGARLPDASVFVTGDAFRLTQVLDNLLSNALKYSQDDAPVAVGLAVEEGTAHFAVSDEGTGIPEEYLSHLFDRFYRVPGIEVQSGSGVGLGLGLFITKAIVDHHHGRIWAESQVGKGTTLHVTLPLAQ